MSFLLADGIEVRTPWTSLPALIHLKQCHTVGLTNAEDAHQNCLSFPSGPDIDVNDVDRIVSAIERFMEHHA